MKYQLMTAATAVAITAVIASSTPALASLPGPGGGGCSLKESGGPGNISFTAHITDSCAYPARSWVDVSNIPGDESTKYGNTLHASGSSKVSWSILDSLDVWGWEYYVGGHWYKKTLGHG
ncbi:hypothetical protein [Allobranchiibius huperziae]|uniref:Uncharacterized protein n=1 Tax=Allobranchiibius huperziae TaxID=1874116 RepID=A0A853DDL0_9MICO|nr:hypothetical protein [Allobranchiibius huperziae]NYJ74083.1 hypothetical protein [Allobranchiibius huperziae]